MKFRDIIQRYLLTEGRTKSISKDQFVDLLKTKCVKINSLDDVKIYRGVKTDMDYGLIEPANYTRKSKGGTDIYQTLISGLPSWSEQQDRTKSLIGTTESGDASRYGSIYCVIPFKEAIFSTVREEDFWLTISRNTDFHPAAYEHIIDKIYYIETGDSTERIKLDYNKLRSFLESVTLDGDYTSVFKKNAARRKFYNAWKESGNQTLFDYLAELFSPSNLGVELKHQSDFNFREKRSEVWTESPCLIVKSETLIKLVHEV